MSSLEHCESAGLGLVALSERKRVLSRLRVAGCELRGLGFPKPGRKFVILGGAKDLLVAMVVGAAALGASAQTAPDPLLSAMQQELAREQTELVLPGLQRPYFMEYRLEDIRTYDAVANYGALTSETQNHQRVVAGDGADWGFRDRLELIAGRWHGAACARGRRSGGAQICALDGDRRCVQECVALVFRQASLVEKLSNRADGQRLQPGQTADAYRTFAHAGD